MNKGGGGGENVCVIAETIITVGHRTNIQSDRFVVGVPNMSAGQKYTVELSREKDPHS